MKYRYAETLGTTVSSTSLCSPWLLIMAAWVAILGATPSFADNTVQLKVLVLSTGSETTDLGLAYIRPVLDEMGVPYDVLDASKATLTAEMLSPGGCAAEAVGCIGNYNGIILTNADMTNVDGSQLAPSEWGILHQYEKDFRVREAVLSGWPGQYWDPDPPWGIYLDYGLTVTSWGSFPNTQWTGPAGGQTVFEYVNTGSPLPVTDWAYAAIPRNDGIGPRDGTVPSVEPLLTNNGETLLSIIRYNIDGQTVREVLLSTITNAWFLVHSQVLAYEFINFATQGVFVGGRHVYMSAHLDDLFIADELWDMETKTTSNEETYRLTGDDITNGVLAQKAFRALHPTAGSGFKLDFAFNGAGAVVNPDAALKKLTIDWNDDLVAAVVAKKNQFRFINHTFSHADMDIAPDPPDSDCDYPTFTNLTGIIQEITKNNKVWNLLGLPEMNNNKRVLISGNHSGLKDRKCTDIPELHPELDNVQADDVPFPDGANPLFLKAAAQEAVQYLAGDSSQLNQNVEQYISQVNDGSNTDRILLPRWPANIFYNVINPEQLVDEYNYLFYYRYEDIGQDPCAIPGAICSPRDYAEILAAESDTALRHMLSFRKWPHYFHQSNLANYDDGSTLQFDWLDAAFAEYEKLFTLPVINVPFYLLGDKTKQRLIAKSAIIKATWSRTTNEVTLSANKSVPNLLVTGLYGGEFYGGQFILSANVSKESKRFTVDQALTQ